MKTIEQPQTMQCDLQTGVCEILFAKEKELTVINKPVRLLYFTDPICSSCWGIEPQLRKLKQEYGVYFSIDYKMGGLLKSWAEYGGKDVSNPADVAIHWDEASTYYQMPIDGDVWKEDPLDSSYPPSIAFKAAQLQNAELAEQFLRRIREMVFLEKKNITKWEHLAEAALETGLDVVRFHVDYHNKAEELFQQDLDTAKQWGVRGFPTLFLLDSEGNQFKVFGSKPYEQFEQALLKLVPDAKKQAPPTSYETVLDWYNTLTTKEFAFLNNKKNLEAEIILHYMEEQQQVEKKISKNGPLWKKASLGV